jgi:hypothetical protein
VCGGALMAAREGCSTKESVSKSSCAAYMDAEESVIGVGPPGGKSQPRVLSSWRISRRIMASGTRAPDRIVLSALIPGDRISRRILIGDGESNTERGLVFDIVAKKISGTDC